MEQGLIYKKIAIVGLGAAGGLCAVLLSKNPYLKVVGFDTKSAFSTLLPTGGGRCNITFDEDDNREFAKNYPRGEKFLLSVFSQFNQKDTRRLFSDLGIETYSQKDKRVFPVSNSSYETVKILRNHLYSSDFKFKKEKVTEINISGNGYEIITESSKYNFDVVIIAAGGKDFSIFKNLNHKINTPMPSLCSLDIIETDLYKLAGLSLTQRTIKAVTASNKYTVQGDILFAHKFITGPGIFKISALSAKDIINQESLMEISFNLTDYSEDEILNFINKNSKKTVKNVMAEMVSSKLAHYILAQNNIPYDKQCAQLNKKEKSCLLNSLSEFKIHVKKRVKGTEIVTAGGVNPDEINPKTMESKLYKNLFIIGEVLDIDGFTGGFNLQNCWSGAYICSRNFE